MASQASGADIAKDFLQFFTKDSQCGIMKYGYLAPGDRFGAVTKNPGYYVPDDELRTLEEHRAQLVGLIGARRRPTRGAVDAEARGSPAASNHIVEWGPGPADIVERKTLPLLSALAGSGPLSYEPVDVQVAYAREAAQAVERGTGGAAPPVATRPTEADFMGHAEALTAEQASAACMLCWGVTFGNFHGAERERLIGAIKSYDMACFTVDLNLDLPSLSAAYDNVDSHNFIMGPLEYFQLQLETGVLTGVDGFDLSAWTPEVAFEEEHRSESGAVDELRMVGYVRSRRDQTLTFRSPELGGDRAVRIAEGERFQVVESRKYSAGRLRELFDQVPSRHPRRIATSLVGEGCTVGLVVVSGDGEGEVEDEGLATAADVRQGVAPSDAEASRQDPKVSPLPSRTERRLVLLGC